MIYLGIFSSFIMNVMYLFLMKKNKDFSLKRLTISHLVHYKNTASLFTITTIGVALVRMEYFSVFIERFSLSRYPVVVFLIFITLGSMLMLGIISLAQNEKLHQFFGSIAFLLSAILLTYFHFFYHLTGSSILQTIGQIIITVALLGTAGLWIKYRTFGLAEAFFTFMTFVWDAFILYCYFQ